MGELGVNENVSRDKHPAGSPEWRREHGISDEVYEARGYIRYEAGDLGPIQEEFRRADCSPDQITWAENKAKLSSGLIMRAHALPLPGLRPVPSQLRPDVEIERRPVLHYHPLAQPESGTPVVDPTTGKRVPESDWSTARARKRHIVGHKDHGKALAAERRYVTKDDLHRLCFDRSCRDDLEWVLANAANVSEPHWHQDVAKYVLTQRRRRIVAHDHADYRKSGARERHVAKYHGGRDVIGRHVHDGTRFPLVTYWDDDPLFSPGKRIDMLPLAWELLLTAEVVYFVLEGKLKADAALSQIIARGLPATVANVPSIWQWEADELDAFCAKLAGKTVVVVVDSDADENEQVMAAGLMLRFRLQEHGLLACLAAPPPDPSGEKAGLDDHLGKLGGSLDGLQVIRRAVSVEAFEAWLRDYAGRGLRWDALRRDARVLYGLALLCGPMGMTTAWIQKIARFVGMAPKSAKEAIESLRAAGVVDVDKPTSLTLSHRWHLKDEVKRSIWKEPPTLMIQDDALYAYESRAPIAEWLRDPPREDRYTVNQLIEESQWTLDVAYWFATHGASVKKTAEHFGISEKRVREMPEIQTMRGLYEAERDLLIALLGHSYRSSRDSSRRMSPDEIAETLTNLGVEGLSRSTVRRVLVNGTGAPRSAQQAVKGDRELRELSERAFWQYEPDKYDPEAVEQLAELLWADIRPRDENETTPEVRRRWRELVGRIPAPPEPAGAV
jgi:hypothetical protein